MAFLRALQGYLGTVIALVVLVLYFSLTTDNFLSVDTFRNIANQSPAITLIAVGMTFVLLIGAIDLSVGSVLGVSGALLGVIMLRDIPMALPAGILAAVGCGLLCGLLSGAVTVHWALPSFIVTLGMLEIARGTAYLVTDSRTMYIGAGIGRIADTHLLGLSLPFAIALAAVAAGQVLLNATIFGRYVLAIGANEEAARLAGVNTRAVKRAVFVLCGALTGLAAVLHTARLQAADPNAGYGMELQAIAAVVIGGTSLLGGRGSVVGSFLGVLIIAVLNTGLAQAGAQEPVKRLITGLVIVAAVLADYYRRRNTRT
ncbi:MAG: transporter permease [Candidatus Hydrogenedentota bacterium]|jgi:ribose transport system permease protein